MAEIIHIVLYSLRIIQLIAGVVAIFAMFMLLYCAWDDNR